jgi:hypothetical protein
MAAQDYIAGYPFAGVTRNPFNYVKVEQIDRDVVTPWLTLDEISQQINLYEDESQDTYLKSLELAVRQAVEDYLGLSIFPVTYRVWYGPESLTATPCALDLPEVSQNQYPSQAGVTIEAVKYYNSNVPATVVTVSSSTYQYDPTGNKVIVQSLPSDINSGMTAPIIVEYTTAPNPLQTYPVIKQAGLLLFTHLYNNRSNTTTANSMREIPFGFRQLLQPYKPLVL